MKFALVICLTTLGGQILQAHGGHHYNHHHGHHGHHGHHNLHAYLSHTPHLRDNIGATLQSTYFGSSFQPNECGQQQCLGSYSGSNIFVQPSDSSYANFALHCRRVLDSLMNFLSKPVEYNCAPGSVYNLDLQSRIVNHNLQCPIECHSKASPIETVIVPEVSGGVSVPEVGCNSDCGVQQVAPVEAVHVQEPVKVFEPVQVRETVRIREPVQIYEPVRVQEPVHVYKPIQIQEPVQQVIVEKAPVQPVREVIYEEPEIISPHVKELLLEEQNDESTKAEIKTLHKQLHHLMHAQKKHHHHHHHH